MDSDTLTVEWVATTELHPNPANPRLNDAAVGPVADSLRRFGWQQPIVARRTGEVVAGHTRLLAAKQLGMDSVPVFRFEGSDLDAVAFGIADNRTASFAAWDEPALAKLLAQLQAEDSLAAVGFTEEEVAVLLRAQEEEVDDDDGPGELPENPVTQPGDLWLLGDHRLLCGDSTDAANMAHLLAGEQPRLMVTDPPYGVEYDPSWRNEAGVSSTTRTGKVANDDRVDWTAVWKLFPGAVCYVWHAGRHCGEVAANLHEAGFDIRAQIIWAKSRFALSRGNYHWQHEPCWYAVRKGNKAYWVGDRKQSTVWDIAVTDDGDKTRHGTQKPLECMARPMRNHDARVVLDPFLGSGSTLVAAHKLGRQCLGMELDPRYVDVAIERWHKVSGQRAVLDGSSESFSDVAAKRGIE